MVATPVAAILLSFAAILGYLNVRYLQLPATIGIMLISLIFSSEKAIPEAVVSPFGDRRVPYDRPLLDFPAEASEFLEVPQAVAALALWARAGFRPSRACSQNWAPEAGARR